MSYEFSAALLNYERGGQRESGQFDFTKLQAACADVDEAPACFLINEANEWGVRGYRGLFGAVNALSDCLGRGYTGVVGVGDRGPGSVPAFIYDPQVFRLDFWGGKKAVSEDKYNVAEGHVAGHSRKKFRFVIRHAVPNDSDRRLAQAKEIDSYGLDPRPTLFGADMNCTASGPHMPVMDWERAHPRTREHKALLQADGSWVADTRAVDHLIGAWDQEQGSRYSRLGWYALAELAHASGTSADLAFMPTVNRGIDRGDSERGGLLIDFLIANEAWKEGLVPGTYRVHVPPGDRREDYPSDHRLVTATMRI